MNITYYQQTLERHGPASTLYYAAYRALNRFTEATLWNALVITPDRLDARIKEEAARVEVKELDADAMRPFIGGGTTLTAEFIDDAAARGDRCFAVLDGGRLANYGWYSRAPTRLFDLGPAVTLQFDDRYAYMHNGFTAPASRGRRLHAISMAVALLNLERRGVKGLLTYVATSNFASLKSCERMGYRCFGRFAAIRWGGELKWLLTPGCRRFGFCVSLSPTHNAEPHRPMARR